MVEMAHVGTTAGAARRFGLTPRAVRVLLPKWADWETRWGPRFWERAL